MALKRKIAIQMDGMAVVSTFCTLCEAVFRNAFISDINLETAVSKHLSVFFWLSALRKAPNDCFYYMILNH